jgi:hypothetical protein
VRCKANENKNDGWKKILNANARHEGKPKIIH